jgi:[acyl-carrier-protein] S-malonyltransferase
VPVFANVLAAPLRDPAEIRKALVAQVTSTVRWRESMAGMAAQGVKVFCELGAGKVLSGLVKRTAPEAQGLSLGTPGDIAENAARLKQG